MNFATQRHFRIDIPRPEWAQFSDRKTGGIAGRSLLTPTRIVSAKSEMTHRKFGKSQDGINTSQETFIYWISKHSIVHLCSDSVRSYLKAKYKLDFGRMNLRMVRYWIATRNCLCNIPSYDIAFRPMVCSAGILNYVRFRLRHKSVE